MCANAEQIGQFRQSVERGEYEVSPKRVAAAMLERIGALALDRELLSPGESARHARLMRRPAR